jgi:hypothetical protein
MVCGANASRELLRRLHDRIHLPPEQAFRLGQALHHGAQCHLADDEEVDVAVARAASTSH